MLTDKNGKEWSFQGYIDENGVACGIGTAKKTMGDISGTRKDRTFAYTYTGGFVNDQWEGVGVLSRVQINPDGYPDNWDKYSEFKEGEFHGIHFHKRLGGAQAFYKMGTVLSNCQECFGNYKYWHYNIFNDE